MRYTGIFWCEWLWSAALVGVFALSILLVGCGDDKTGGKEVGTRTAWKPVEEKTVTATSLELERPAPADEPGEGQEPVEVAETEPPREVTYEEAETAYREGRYEEAVELFTRYTDRKTGNPWGFYMLGLSAWKAGEPGIAEKAFENALELDPDHVKSQINLGRVLLDTDRPGEALVRVEQALAIDPESNEAYRLRGRAYSMLGEDQKAIDAYHRAIMIDDRDAWSMNNLGLIFIEEDRCVEALMPLARAVELRDDVAIFRNNLGMALERTGHFRAAEEAYRAAVTIDGSHPSAASNFARIEGVVQDPDIGPINLKELARRFAEEIEGERQVATLEDTPGGAEPDAATTGTTDSTGVEQGQ